MASQLDTKFRGIRNKVLTQNSDRSKYLSLTFVLTLYDEFNSLLKSMDAAEVDASREVINETLLIFSLAFITIGHTSESISLYAKILSFRTIYEFLSCALYITPKELSLLEAALINSEVQPEKDGEDQGIAKIPYLNDEIWNSMKEIQVLNSKAAEVMNLVPEQEFPLNSQLIHLRRDVLAEVIREDFSSERLEVLHHKFERLEAHVASAEWPVSSYTKEQCVGARQLLEWFKTGVQERDIERGDDPELLPVFRRLREMLPELDVFVMTRRWTLRATDLFQHMDYLLKIMPKLVVTSSSWRQLDSSIGANLCSSIGDVSGEDVMVREASAKSDKYFTLVTYMARRAWSLIYKLLESTEPVSEALSSYYNQLLTLKRCLNEVRLAGGISNLRELYPFQMKLSSMDASRQDGKFYVNGEVPPGQGVINSLLAECFDLVYELKVELEEKGEDEEEDEEDDDDDKSKVEDDASSGEDSEDDYDDDNRSMQSPTKEMPSLDDASTISALPMD